MLMSVNKNVPLNLSNVQCSAVVGFERGRFSDISLNSVDDFMLMAEGGGAA